MSTFTPPAAIASAIRALTSHINNLADTIATAFGLLPDETKMKLETVNYLTSGGSANAYTLALTAITGSYTDGQLIVFKANHTNTGAATMNVNGIGVKSLRGQDGSALVAGDLIANKIYTFRYNATATSGFDMQGLSGGNITNVATVAGIAGNVTTVAGISANVTTVAGISADVTTVAAIPAGDVAAVAAVDSEVSTCAGIAADISTVAAAGGIAAPKVINAFGRDMTATTGTVSYTGAGGTPRGLIVSFVDSAGTIMGNGVDDGTTHQCSYSNSSGTAQDTSWSIACINGAGAGQRGYVASFDADGCTIQWGKYGSPTGYAYLIFTYLF